MNPVNSFLAPRRPLAQPRLHTQPSEWKIVHTADDRVRTYFPFRARHEIFAVVPWQPLHLPPTHSGSTGDRPSSAIQGSSPQRARLRARLEIGWSLEPAAHEFECECVCVFPSLFLTHLDAAPPPQHNTATFPSPSPRLNRLRSTAKRGRLCVLTLHKFFVIPPLLPPMPPCPAILSTPIDPLCASVCLALCAVDAVGPGDRPAPARARVVVLRFFV